MGSDSEISSAWVHPNLGAVSFNDEAFEIVSMKKQDWWKEAEKFQVDKRQLGGGKEPLLDHYEVEMQRALDKCFSGRLKIRTGQNYFVRASFLCSDGNECIVEIASRLRSGQPIRFVVDFFQLGKLLIEIDEKIEEILGYAKRQLTSMREDLEDWAFVLSKVESVTIAVSSESKNGRVPEIENEIWIHFGESYSTPYRYVSVRLGIDATTKECNAGFKQPLYR